MAGDLLAWGWRTGSWWLPLLVVALGFTALAAGSAQVVVPKVAYTLF